MKVLVKCKNLKYEDISKIEYVNKKVLIYTKDKILEYSIKNKLGTYLCISEDGIEYFTKEGYP